MKRVSFEVKTMTCEIHTFLDRNLLPSCVYIFWLSIDWLRGLSFNCNLR